MSHSLRYHSKPFYCPVLELTCFPCEQHSTSVICFCCHCSRQHSCEQMPLQVHSPVASGRSVTRHHLLPPILPLTSIRCARQRPQEKARRARPPRHNLVRASRSRQNVAKWFSSSLIMVVAIANVMQGFANSLSAKEIGH